MPTLRYYFPEESVEAVPQLAGVTIISLESCCMYLETFTQSPLCGIHDKKWTHGLLWRSFWIIVLVIILGF